MDNRNLREFGQSSNMICYVAGTGSQNVLSGLGRDNRECAVVMAALL